MTSSVTDRNSGLVGGAGMKQPVRVGSTGNLTLSSSQTVDGVAVVSGNRVLVKDQTDTTENGIYVVDTGDWIRAADFDGPRDIATGQVVFVNAGTNGQGFWYLTSTGTDLDTDAISWTKASTVLSVVTVTGQALLASTSTAAVLSLLGFSTFAQTLIDDSSAVDMRATLNIGKHIGQIVHTSTGGTASGTTIMPVSTAANTPTSTQGDQFLATSFTAISANSQLLVDGCFNATLTTNNFLSVALFSTTSTAALAATAGAVNAANGTYTIPVHTSLTAGTTLARTFSMRAGTSASGTVLFNSSFFPSAGASFIRITELMTSTA